MGRRNLNQKLKNCSYCAFSVKMWQTILSSNLRPTTGECVHLVTRVVTSGHVTKKWQSHQSIRHSRKSHDVHKPNGSILYRTGVMGDRSLRE